MAAFHQFQRVRIVNMGATGSGIYDHYIGSECVLMEAVETRTAVGGPWVAGWETDLPHPYGDRLCVAESQIEPLKFLPSPEDFVSLERVPPDVLREAVGA